MHSYTAPLRDMRFVLKELAGLEQIARLPGYTDASPDLVDAVLDEAAKFASTVLAPLNTEGDRSGARWDKQSVTMPPGFRAAYQQFVDNGWASLAANPEFGGQGLPLLVSAAAQEMWKSANMAFALCPMLTIGAADTIEFVASAEQKARFLPPLVSGEWTGTMNLTEPQAGSDLAAIRTRAEPQADGTFRIFGQKIFITYGEHDMAANTLHLVLARLPDAPPGVKGISLFLVPKFLVNADGTLGAHNDVTCASIEHKLGIHASPTCVMVYGESGQGAEGYLLGEPHQGLATMFVMMNAARFAVGLEGLALSEVAYQKAVAYAHGRVQGRAIEGSAESVAIIRHPDVRRMLMLMRAQTEAMRALAYVVAAAQDAATHDADPAERERSHAFVDLLTPVIKGWCTETANEVAYLCMQVHGGAGYIEETGVSQLLRDARITTIYEGTTGIQANDLVGRKVAKDGGAALLGLMHVMQQTCATLEEHGSEDLAHIAKPLNRAIDALAQAAEFIVNHYGSDIRSVMVGSVPFLRLFGLVAGGWMMARAALVAQSHIDAGEAFEDDKGFYPAKLITARFYADHVLSTAMGLARTVVNGGSSALDLPEDYF
ncbi:MAG TPA: acyl-CoA dehydrogenase [Rhodocyclaceae bacterium]|nr:acyl-CoA dehydrogenase [Rhodocyclaceae bacterium]